jgi:hypothetical protein
MQIETNGTLNDSWDEYISGNFLKSEHVENDNQAFICMKIESVIDTRNESNEKRLRLALESKNINYDMDLNKTNAAKCKELGIKAPKELIGKKIYFKKVLVRNPKINKEVESLRIWKIE